MFFKGGPVCRGSLGLATLFQLLGLGNLTLDFLDKSRQVGLGRGNGVLGILHAGEQAVGDLERMLGIADNTHERALLAGGLGLEFAAAVEELLGLGEGDLRHVRVVGDGGQRLLGVGPTEGGQQGAGLRQTAAQVHRAAGKFIQLGAGIDEQVTHVREVRCLLVQCIVGLTAGGDDLNEHLAALSGGLRQVVVELLLQLEGLLQGQR